MLRRQAMVYLDYNATTPLHPNLKAQVLEMLEISANPSSVHSFGRFAKKNLTKARENFAAFIGAQSLEVVWTSGGSEANNLAIKGLALARANKKKHLIISAVEHPSIKKTAEFLERMGFEVSILSVLKTGAVDLEQLKKLVREDTLLVSVQYVNNETGNIFPLKEISEICHAKGALLHSDMVQALGKIPVDVKALGVDLASFAGHKFYAMKGAGALYVRTGLKLESLIHGGGQERSRRAGTENLLAAYSLGEACRVLGPESAEQAKRLENLRKVMEKETLEFFPQAIINGVESPRVTNTSNITFPDIDGETLLINLDSRGFAVSSGAACSSGSQEPSPVLLAMGLTRRQASESLRVSLGWMTTESDIANFVVALKESLDQIRTAQADVVPRYSGGAP